MTLLQIRKLKKEFGYRQILKDVSFDVKQGARLGIVGDNGAGKTTLMKIIAGELKQDEGQIDYGGNIKDIGYLPQSTDYYIRNINDKNNIDMGEHKSFMGINTLEEQDYSTLSGGEQTKLALANIFAMQPTLLFLDEPTNHLDQQGIEYLINLLEEYDGTVIIISHDRYFLDQTVTEIVELERGESKVYKGNYTAYRSMKEEDYKSRLHAYEEEEKRRQEVKREIKRLRQWSDKGHRESTKPKKGQPKMGLKEKYRARAKKKDKQVKSKIKQLEKLNLEGTVKPEEEQDITFQLVAQKNQGKVIIEARDLVLGYEEKKLIKPSSFYIKKGERIGIIGSNGCGKTTFIKALRQQIPLLGGHLYMNPNLKVGYMSQDVLDLPEDKTIMEYFDVQGFQDRGVLQTLLNNMGIHKDILPQHIKDLSLGERTRIKLAYMIIHQHNVLLLDEPTNHLDLHTREMLEKTLAGYEGTLIVISHDRYFMEKLCDKVLVFKEGKVNRYEGSYKDFLTRKEEKPKENAQKEQEMTLLQIENQIAAVLGQLSVVKKESSEYEELDETFKHLLQQKKQLV